MMRTGAAILIAGAGPAAGAVIERFYRDGGQLWSPSLKQDATPRLHCKSVVLCTENAQPLLDVDVVELTNNAQEFGYPLD